MSRFVPAAAALSLTLAVGCSGTRPGAPGDATPSSVTAVATPSSATSGATPSSATPGATSSTAPSPVTRTDAPELSVEVVTDRLEHGWDVGFLPDGQVLVTERPGRITLLSTGRARATVTRVAADLTDLHAVGEGGLLGMVVHPDFATTREFTTCLNHSGGGHDDIRLVTWRLADDGRSASRVRDLLTGIPAAPGGRHSGCRPTIAADGALLVGTGDTADPAVPQDLTSLGGKVLRLDLRSGKPLPDNPFAGADDERQRYVYTYGHRNVQGVAVQPGTGAIWSAEHGPRINDEVNLLRPGGNYGWDPSRGVVVSFYDEDVPMTDTGRFPDAIAAAWESGATTEAICGAAFLEGDQWGAAEGALAITALKGAKLLLLTVSGDHVSEVSIPSDIAERFGRLRAARTGPDGALYVTTSNGDDDALLRITPG